MRSFCVSGMLLLGLCLGRVAAAEPAVPIGSAIENFTLNDVQGQPHSLDELAGNKGVVLAFLGTECPLARLYVPTLVGLAEKYAPSGIAFIGLDSNRQDGVTEIAAFTRDHGVSFPVLKDLKQVVADRVGATRTPEVIVLDAERKIRYRGRIDDQYGFQQNASYHRSAPDKRELAAALDAILADKPVEVAQTEAPGCLIGRDLVPVADAQVTYSKHVAPIFNEHCVGCHRPGQIGPFTLTSYEDAVGWAAMVDEVVRERRMPPWHADEKFGHFQNNAELTAEERDTIAKWVAAGAPEGNPDDLPPAPEFYEGWNISQPDQVVYMTSEVPFEVPATGVVDYQYFPVDPGWKEDKWIKEIELRPGNAAVVHHIMLLIIPPGGPLGGGVGSGNDFLWAYAPGLVMKPLAEGMARFVPAGSRLVFQVHYTPNGKPTRDQSYCGFVFTDKEKVRQEVRVNSAPNFVFQIPPGDPGFEVKSRYIFREDTQLLTLFPHMHARGKSFRFEATYPDGKKETLLNVPRYDYGWQTLYRLAEPKLLPAGSRLDCVAQFDNSTDNLNNPDPNKAVRFGDQMFEEMMIGFFEVASANEDLSKGPLPPRSRLDDFQLILKATGGEPDDNVKVGAFMALLEPGIFSQFSLGLRTLVPQIDRVCVTALKDGQLVELFGPVTSAAQSKSQTGKEVLRLMSLAVREGEPVPETILSPYPPLDAEGESIADYITGGKPVVLNDLSEAHGKLVEMMVRRGAKSSMHIPATVNGLPVVVNYWSKDPGAFIPPAQALLAGLTQIMTAPKSAAQLSALQQQ